MLFIDPLFLQEWAAFVDFWIIVTMMKGPFELVVALYYCNSVKSDQMPMLCFGGSSIFRIVFVSVNMLWAVLIIVASRLDAKYSSSSCSSLVNKRSNGNDGPPSYEDAMQKPSASLSMAQLDTAYPLKEGPPPYAELEICDSVSVQK